MECLIFVGLVKVFVEGLALFAVYKLLEFELLFYFVGFVEIEVAFELGIEAIVWPDAL